MKRPLLAAALCVAIAAAVWIETGTAERVRPGCISIRELDPGGTLSVTGQVYQKEEESIYLQSVSIIFSDSNAAGQSIISQQKLNENLICETKQAPEITLGSRVTLEGVIMPFSQASNPGEFDGAVYYRTLGVGGRLRETVVLSVENGGWPLREGLFQLKSLFKKRLYHVFPEKEAAVMSALLLGEKKDLDEELKNLYKSNGILHIFSISSLHITIIGMGVYQLLRKGGMPICPAACAGSVLLILYGCMTGFSVSACRAIGMYLLRMLAETAGRTYDMLTALGVMAAVMVIRNPYCLQSGGFLLSFTSVLGIGVVFPALAPEKTYRAAGENTEKMRWIPNCACLRKYICKINPTLKMEGKIKRKRMKKRNIRERLQESLQQAAFASLSITLTTLPVQLWLYYEIPTYSIFLNLLVIPLLKPLMTAGILTLAPGLGFLSGIDSLILQSYEFLCECFGRLPFHTWNPGRPAVWQIIVYYLLLLGVTAAGYARKKKKEKCGGHETGTDRGMDGRAALNAVRRAFPNDAGKASSNAARSMALNAVRSRNKSPAKGSALAGIAALCLGIWLLGVSPADTDSVTFLDVGQGDCVLVRTASGQTYLFDCGSSSRGSVGKYVLIPYLKYHGIHTIDALFLSHPDADHVNGALELLELSRENRIMVRQLLLPAIEESAREEEFGELLQAVSAASSAQGSEIPTGYLSAGETWDCGGAFFTCLHPSEGYSGENANAYSECFYVEFRGEKGSEWSLLLTGDVEGTGEEALFNELRTRDIHGITVLKAAHHGSRNSSSEALLRQVNPNLTVISCGRNNRYGHPHKELLERLEQVDTYIMRTAESGAVTVTFRTGKLHVSSMLGEK